MATTDLQVLHAEVLDALKAAAPEGFEVGERIRVDRRSELEHLGLRTPVRRKIVKAGFSFYDRDENEILRAWDGIWHLATCGDVLFAVLDYYREQLKSSVAPEFWSVATEWIDKVDNWAHADDLARVISWALAARPDEVYPTLVGWNRLEHLWHRRVSIVSLVHYSGKNAVFLSPEEMFPLLENLISDNRPEIQKAIGWVLREMTGVYAEDSIGFIERHRDNLSSVALKRAIERLDRSTKMSLLEGSTP